MPDPAVILCLKRVSCICLTNGVQNWDFMAIWILQRSEVLYAKKLCPPESFSVVISSYCELEDGPIIKQKAKILWVLKKLQNYRDFYQQPLEHDWSAKHLAMQKISNVHKNPLLYSLLLNALSTTSFPGSLYKR